MLKKYSQFFQSILILQDVVVTGIAWILSYYLRIYGKIIPLTKGIPPFYIYIDLLPFILLISYFTYRYFSLYVPRRVGTRIREFWDIVKANVILFFILPTFTFYYAGSEYSRIVVFIFPFINTFLLCFSRGLIRILLRHVRRRGWNTRNALIIGAGKIGQNLAQIIARNPWSGIHIVGFLDERTSRINKDIFGIPVLGKTSDLPNILVEKNIDQIYIALPFSMPQYLPEIINNLAYTTVDVMVIPDTFNFVTLNKNVWDFDGIPIISLRESPLSGWNIVLKRAIDISLSFMILLFVSIPMCIIALLIKLTSRGPIFYCQERMGLDGRVFKMIKFRTMKVDAEKETGAIWATSDDPRRTWCGTFLRKTSMDELPQFINVLKGEMSVVGPRPERPVFIEKFKKEIPGYMLRHKMKAGITGWAQVNGWRGDTSLKKRIQYDLYYIEHWSIWFDLKIVFLTVFKGLVNQNAY